MSASDSEDSDGPASELTPSPATFHVVKRLASVVPSSASFLCLPRGTPHPDRNAPEPLSSTLKPHLLVVKMRTHAAALRAESSLLSYLHEQPNSRASIDAWILREQHTGDARSSFLVLRPVCGRDVGAFGAACTATLRVPGYFVWHVFLGLVGALEFLHGADVAHGAISSKTVLLGRRDEGARFRDWPDVLLTDFDAAERDAGAEAKNRDVRACLEIVSGVIERVSDVAPLLKVMRWESSEEPIVMLASVCRDVIEGRAGTDVTLEDVKNGWAGVAEEEREKGPKKCPAWILEATSDDLASGEELDRAFGKELVFRFKRGAQKFKELARVWERETRAPVGMRMRRGRRGLLILKFRLKENRERVAAVGG